MDEKKKLRKQLKEAYAQILPEERKARSRALVRQILETAELREYETVFCYVSFGYEPETRELLEALTRMGKTLLVPRCGNDGFMEAVRIRSMDDLHPGLYGIPEPGPDLPAFPPERIDLSIVPAYAISPEGIRLGKGGGYYDRFLPRTRGRIWGLTFFVCPVPAEPHDRGVDRTFADSMLHVIA